MQARRLGELLVFASRMICTDGDCRQCRQQSTVQYFHCWSVVAMERKESQRCMSEVRRRSFLIESFTYEPDIKLSRNPSFMRMPHYIHVSPCVPLGQLYGVVGSLQCVCVEIEYWLVRRVVPMNSVCVRPTQESPMSHEECKRTRTLPDPKSR